MSIVGWARWGCVLLVIAASASAGGRERELLREYLRVHEWDRSIEAYDRGLRDFLPRPAERATHETAARLGLSAEELKVHLPELLRLREKFDEMRQKGVKEEPDEETVKLLNKYNDYILGRIRAESIASAILPKVETAGEKKKFADKTTEIRGVLKEMRERARIEAKVPLIALERSADMLFPATGGKAIVEASAESTVRERGPGTTSAEAMQALSEKIARITQAFSRDVDVGAGKKIARLDARETKLMRRTLVDILARDRVEEIHSLYEQVAMESGARFDLLEGGATLRETQSLHFYDSLIRAIGALDANGHAGLKKEVAKPLAALEKAVKQIEETRRALENKPGDLALEERLTQLVEARAKAGAELLKALEESSLPSEIVVELRRKMTKESAEQAVARILDIAGKAAYEGELARLKEKMPEKEAKKVAEERLRKSVEALFCDCSGNKASVTCLIARSATGVMSTPVLREVIAGTAGAATLYLATRGAGGDGPKGERSH